MRSCGATIAAARGCHRCHDSPRPRHRSARAVSGHLARRGGRPGSQLRPARHGDAEGRRGGRGRQRGQGAGRRQRARGRRRRRQARGHQAAQDGLAGLELRHARPGRPAAAGHVAGRREGARDLPRRADRRGRHAHARHRLADRGAAPAAGRRRRPELRRRPRLRDHGNAGSDPRLDGHGSRRQHHPRRLAAGPERQRGPGRDPAARRRDARPELRLRRDARHRLARARRPRHRRARAA